MSKSDFILLSDCLRMMFHISLLQREWLPKVHSLNFCSSYTAYFWFAYFIWSSREHYRHITDKTFLPQGFSLVISFEIRKWFPNVSKYMIFLRFPPNWIKSLRPKCCIYLRSSYRRKLKTKKPRTFNGDLFSVRSWIFFIIMKISFLPLTNFL